MKITHGVPSLTAEKQKIIECLRNGENLPFSIEGAKIAALLKNSANLRAEIVAHPGLRSIELVRRIHPDAIANDRKYKAIVTQLNALERFGLIERVKDSAQLRAPWRIYPTAEMF